MKSLPISVITGACAAGLLGGWSASRFHGNRETDHARAEAAEIKGVALQTKGRARSLPSEDPRSAENFKAVAEMLAEATADPSAYERLALWLLDANAAEIASLWESLPQPEQLGREAIDLIFVFWARLDPEAAIAATKGTKFAPHAWRAWTCHDPRRALDEVQLRAPERMPDVAYALRTFHPKWLRDHQEEIPASVRMPGLAVFPLMEGLDPFEQLELSKTNGYLSYGVLYQAVRIDPVAAWAWIKERGSLERKNLLQVARILEERHPEALSRILLEPEAAELKRLVDEERFRRLLKVDPVAALKEAEAFEEPRLATARLTALGQSLVREDPEAAFRLAQRMFELNPDALFDRPPRPGDWEGSRAENKETLRLMAALISHDPERVLALVPATDSFGMAKLGKIWAEQDADDYANWINSGTDPTLRNQATGILVGQLIQQEDYAEAAEWLLSIPKPGTSRLQHLYQSWRATDPFTSEAWLERVDLPEAELQEIRSPIREGGG